MKILFVEDELSKNIPKIVRIFEKYLGKKRKKKLESLESDESGYGADPEEIKNIVEDTQIIEVEYKFPTALEKIINHYDKYALYIVDRNLSLSQYDFDQITLIDDQFTDSLYDNFFEREGDYLLQKLIYSGIDVLTKFYFLTAYSAADELRNSAEVKTHIDFGKFKNENFIEKGKDEYLQKLKDILENISILNLRVENKHYLNILHTCIHDELAENFVKVLSDLENKKRIGDNLKDIRNIYEQILKASAEKIPEMKNHCLTEYGNPLLGKETIDWLYKNKHINSIHRNFFFSIKAIASDFGAHDSKKKHIYEPTVDTVKSLVYALKDSILWLNDICREYQKK